MQDMLLMKTIKRIIKIINLFTILKRKKIKKMIS